MKPYSLLARSPLGSLDRCGSCALLGQLSCSGRLARLASPCGCVCPYDAMPAVLTVPSTAPYTPLPPARRHVQLPHHDDVGRYASRLHLLERLLRLLPLPACVVGADEGAVRAVVGRYSSRLRLLEPSHHPHAASGQGAPLGRTVGRQSRNARVGGVRVGVGGAGGGGGGRWRWRATAAMMEG